ncbi:MAG: GreA/GreB family elongation factor [Chlamydiales bacterium]
MSYSEDFRQLIEEGQLANFLRLWEEYCLADQVQGEELKDILSLIKESNFAQTFGQFAETVLPLWKKVEDQQLADEVLCLVLDLQTTNSAFLADLAYEYLQKHFEADNKYFKEKIRIVGLRSRRSFQGAISNFKLLTHMNKGSFVFHTGGWGVGEVMDISLLREHALFEFEGIMALKELSFDNAFKHLIPLPADHFLARRFGNPDALEKLGKEDPLELIRLLLRDLGPKTAQAIKDELSELVIPEKEWSKWWQTTRTKLKKDTKIKSPKWSKDPFMLREEEMPHEVRFKDLLNETKGIEAEILLIYNFSRDFPEVLKHEDLKQQVKSKLLVGLEEDEKLPLLTIARHIQIYFLLEDIFPKEFSGAGAEWIKKVEHFNDVLNLIEIIAFKKRALTVIRESFDNWTSIFLHLLFIIGQNPIRDYLFKELQNNEDTQELLVGKAHELLNNMTLYPEAFFWYFQKISGKKQVPLNDSENQRYFLEALLILLHYVEDKMEYRDLAKKIYQHLTTKRYQVVRTIIEGASIPYLKEFLLLASKCQIFSKHDLKILHNLAEVVQPTLSKKKGKQKEEDVIWTTQEAFQKIQERVQHIGTVETVENAREIEAARALGDLRENSEYKFALEKRSRLQEELKRLTSDLNKARILTKNDISTDKVGVGATIHLLDSKGHKIHYTLLGPWDADPEHHILSFQSKLAQAMIGCKQGETFHFQGESYTVQKIKNYLS